MVTITLVIAAVFGIEVFQQRAPRERLPPVVARQLDDAVAEPVDREAVADDAEQRGDVVDRATVAVREIGDVERGVQRVERGDALARSSGHALFFSRALSSSNDFRSLPRSRAGRIVARRSTPARAPTPSRATGSGRWR